MATLTLKDHSKDIQFELEQLSKITFIDIPVLINNIVSFALANKAIFNVKEKLSYRDKTTGEIRDFDENTSEKVYTIAVHGDVKRELTRWAREKSIGGVNELLLKHVRFILIVYFAKGLDYDAPPAQATSA